MASRPTVSLICRCETSTRIRVRQVARQRLDVELARLLGEHAALADARRLVGARELERDRGLDRLVEATRRRSACRTSPRTGWRWRSLTITGSAVPPSSDTSSTAWACASVLRRIRASTCEGHRLALAAVDDPGDPAGAAQAAGRAGGLRLAGGELERAGAVEAMGGRSCSEGPCSSKRRGGYSPLSDARPGAGAAVRGPPSVALMLGCVLFWMFMRSGPSSAWKPPDEDEGGGGGGGNDRPSPSPSPGPRRRPAAGRRPVLARAPRPAGRLRRPAARWPPRRAGRARPP